MTCWRCGGRYPPFCCGDEPSPAESHEWYSGKRNEAKDGPRFAFAALPEGLTTTCV